MSGFGSEAEILCSTRALPVLTQLRHRSTWQHMSHPLILLEWYAWPIRSFDRDYVQLEGREEVDRYIQAIKGIVQRGIDFVAASDNGRRQPCITPTLNAWLQRRGRLKMHSAALASRSRKRRQKALRYSKTASARTACSRWLQAGGSSCPVRGYSLRLE